MEDDFEFPNSSAVNDEEMDTEMDESMDDLTEDLPILKVGEEKAIGKTRGEEGTDQCSNSDGDFSSRYSDSETVTTEHDKGKHFSDRQPRASRRDNEKRYRRRRDPGSLPEIHP